MMDPLTTLHCVFVCLLFWRLRPVYSHDVSDMCTYTFQVWRPDENIEHKVKYLELKFANMSSFLDKTLLQFRNKLHVDMNTCHRNRTFRGGRRAGSKVKERALNSGMSGFQRELNEMVWRLDQLTTNYVSLKNRMATSPAPQRAGQLSKPEQNDAVSTAVLENGVNDLKAEWILMKRDLIHLNSENSHIKHAQNRIQRDTVSLNRSVTSLGTKLKVLEMEVDTGIPGPRQRPSQSDAGATDTRSVQQIHTRMEADILNLNNGLQDLRTSLKKVNDHMNLLQNDNVHLKRMIIAASKGKRLTGARTDAAQLMDRTLGETPTGKRS